MDLQTLAVHHGYEKDNQKTMAVPIYQSSAFEFKSADHAAETFGLQHGYNNVYSRIGNPTNDILEQRYTALESGTGALATASGMSAILYSILNVADSGDNIISAEKLYGGTVTLFTHTLKRLGIEVRYFDQSKPEQIEPLIDEKTKAVFFESVTNPSIDLPDYDAITAVAKKHGIVSIIDNTVATAVLCRPIEHGVDVVIHSCSKYTTGQGLTIGGIIIEGASCGELLKGNERYPHFNTPDETYGGIVYAEALTAIAFTFRARMVLLRDTGAALTPFSAWLLIQGLETLPIRVREHAANALALAKYLEAHPKVTKVYYPGLKGDTNNELAQKYMPEGAGGLLSFEVAGFEAAKTILDETKLFSIVVNIGDTKSIITHPASTTHVQLAEDELEAAGVPSGLIRISAGIEKAKDLIDDLSQALDKI